MEITQLYTDRDGNSHFDIVPIIMEENTEFGYFSPPQKNVQHIYFQNILSKHSWESLKADHQVYIIVINGLLELEVTNGEKRDFIAGDVILLNDKSGKGHKAITFENTVGVMLVHMNK